MFGSHLAAARSTDLMNWQYIANGVDATNPLWSTIPLEGNQWTGIPGSWAADVIKLKDGKYHFYYSFCGDSTRRAQCNGPRSYLGVAVSDRIDGPFVDQGIFLRSGMTPAEIAAGYGPAGVTSYDARVHAEHHRPRCFLRPGAASCGWCTARTRAAFSSSQMDETTGKPLPGQGYGKHLAGGDHAPIEGQLHALQPRSRATTIYSRRSAASPRTTATTSASRAPAIPTAPILDAEGRDMADARGNMRQHRALTA